MVDQSSWPEARASLLEDGYCVVDGGISQAFLGELETWSEQLLASTRHSAKWKYQGSDIHVSGVRHRAKKRPDLPAAEIVDRLIEHPQAVLDAMELADLRSGGTFQIISKPPGAPALYWHQDWARWDDPVSLSPWPQQVFLNWYLTSTRPDNGCLRVIPGSHLRRTELHSHLVAPHEGGGYEVDESNEWMFFDHPDARDVCVAPGDLVIADARLLHATHPNRSAERRTVLLGWYYRKSNAVPDGWTGAVPAELCERPEHVPFVWNREPGRFLR